jgi:hypothetical protein
MPKAKSATKTTTKKSTAKKTTKKPVEKVVLKEPAKLGVRASFKLWRARKKDMRALRNQTKVKLHKSFKRSYREDYDRKTELPGLMAHAATTFKVLFKNWKLFIPLIILIVIANIILVGLMSAETYENFKEAIEDTNEEISQGRLGNVGKAGLMLIGTITTGGLSRGMTEVQQVFMIMLLAITWLVTIYLTRHILAGHKLKLRDGLYNALTPLIPTLCIVGLIFIELIPIFFVIIAYSAAIATDFLATPFYALVFFIFAALLVLLSCYLISSSFLALIAVTAPGLYPVRAVNTSNDLIAGRRTRLIIRLIFLIFMFAIIWVVVMMPIILIDFALQQKIDWLCDIPVVPFFLLCMTVFTIVYTSIYSYLFYRKLLDMD